MIDMDSVLILATQYKPNIGGIQTYLEEFTRFLAKNGYFVNVLTFNPRPISRLFKTRITSFEYKEPSEQIKIKRFGYFDFGISHIFQIRTLIEFFLILNMLIHSLLFMASKGKSIKLIHAHDYVTAAVAFVLSKAFHKKWVMSHHSIFPYFKNTLRRRIGGALLKNANLIFANSETVKKQLEKGLGTKRPKIRIAHYWIDHENFVMKDKVEARGRLGLPSDAYIVMFVGRLEIAKGLEEFAKASKTADDNTYFVVVGSGEDYPVIKKNSNPHLIYLGPKYGDAIVDCYNAADVCCFPTAAIEAFGRVAIEALSCGTPVIVSTTATKELIDDSVGMRTDPNSDAITKAISSFKMRFNKPNVREKCREFALKNYSEDNGKVILKEYERLIQN